MTSQDQTAKPYRRRITPIERLFSRSPVSMVTMVARIRGRLSEGDLEQAVAKVRRRHPILRARIVEDGDGSPWFSSDGADEIPVEIFQRESPDHWIRLVQDSSRIPFEFGARPPIRFILVHSPLASDLVILCHHIICDGLSLAYLARDLLQHLGDPAREVEALPFPVPIDRDNIPSDVSLNAVARFFISRMNKKWETEKVVFDQEDYRDLCQTYWANYQHQVLSRVLTGAQTAALVDRCRKEGVTVNSALTAAFVGAQTTVQGPRPSHLNTVVAGSLRGHVQPLVGEAMGFYAGAVRTKYRYQGGLGFWDNARRFHRKAPSLFTNKGLFLELLTWCYLEPTIQEAISFKMLGGLVPEHLPRHRKLSAFGARDDVVARMLKREKMDSLDSPVMDTAVTNLGRLDFPARYGALELERLIMKPGGAFPLTTVNLLVGAVTCAGRLSLLIEYVEASMDTRTVKEVTAQAVGFLLGE
jgi:hypothetical protein